MGWFCARRARTLSPYSYGDRPTAIILWWGSSRADRLAIFICLSSYSYAPLALLLVQWRPASARVAIVVWL